MLTLFHFTGLVLNIHMQDVLNKTKIYWLTKYLIFYQVKHNWWHELLTEIANWQAIYVIRWYKHTFSFKSETWQKCVNLASKYYLLYFFLYGFTNFNLNKYEKLMAATGDRLIFCFNYFLFSCEPTKKRWIFY